MSQRCEVHCCFIDLLGLSGTIPDTIPAESALEAVSLGEELTPFFCSPLMLMSKSYIVFHVHFFTAHNQISGTIPTSLQGRPFLKLDLSFNKLTGTYDDRNDGASQNVSLVLEVNRLSGWFPSPPTNRSASSELNVLRGNLFSCEYIPSEDVYSDDYSCGSEDLEQSLYCWDPQWWRCRFCLLLFEMVSFGHLLF